MERHEVEEYRSEYEEWEKKYSPEFLEYGEEGDANFTKAQNTPNEFVWTNHGTCEDEAVSAGFHFFGDPPSCCWNTYGWYISKVSSGNTGTYESYKSSAFAKCECYVEETEEGKPGCETCEGDGWYTAYFD